MDDGLYHNWQDSPSSPTWSGGVSGAPAAGLGGKAKSITVAVNADHRLELFYIGTNEAIYHNWQTTVNGHWKGEAAFGGSAKQLSLAPDADGRLELFYIGMDDFTYHSWQTTVNGPWAGAPRANQSNFLAATNSGGRIVLFFMGSPQPAPVPTELTFNSQIVLGTGIAAGGSSQLVLRNSGGYTFTGNFHDSGAAEYNTALAWVVKDTDNNAYTITHGGKISGSLEPGPSDDIWTVDSQNDDVRTNWPSIAEKNYAVCKASVKSDLVDVVNLALAATGIVLAVIALFQPPSKPASPTAPAAPDSPGE